MSMRARDAPKYVQWEVRTFRQKMAGRAHADRMRIAYTYKPLSLYVFIRPSTFKACPHNSGGLYGPGHTKPSALGGGGARRSREPERSGVLGSPGASRVGDGRR